MILILILVVLLAGCSSPTAPTPTLPPIVNVPAVVTPTPAPTPVPTPTPAAFPPADSRFDLTFYRQLVHNAYDQPIQPLRRQTQAPRIYLRTIDDAGAAIDAASLNLTASALENTAGALTGVFGLAGLERGTDTRQGQAGWITVRWSAVASPQGYCGQAPVGGDLITLFPRSANCRCSGAVVGAGAIRHELGHSLGFWHSPDSRDLMYGPIVTCDKSPSAREVYHAQLAYGRPVGSLMP